MFSSPYKKKILWLIAIASIVKLIVAGSIELSNDEVYYWLYAKYPALSHFDHPPVVGWVIQLFTLDLQLDGALFIRLGAIVFSALNAWILYHLVKDCIDERSAFYSAALFLFSVYCSIIAGLSILPDSPQLFFWLLTIYLLSKSILISESQPNKKDKQYFLIASVTTALAILSKYHGAIILVGAGLYILLYNRKWLKEPVLYLGIFIALLGALPILIWNYNVDFISFTYHGNRVNMFDSGIRLDYFFTQLGGEALYQNPFVYFVIVLGVIFAYKKLNTYKVFRLLLCVALPLLAVFWFFALFRSTLPHWTGPAYATLIPFGGYFLKEKFGPEKLFPWPLKAAMVLLVTALIAMVVLVNFNPAGMLPSDNNPIHKKGDNDPLLDMQGWKTIKKESEKIIAKDLNGKPIQGCTLLGYAWFPAAHTDYYVARPLGMNLLVKGSLESIHKYYWINQQRPSLNPGDNAYFINVSNYYKDPSELFAEDFETIAALDTIAVYRGASIGRYAIVFKLAGFKQNKNGTY